MGDDDRLVQKSSRQFLTLFAARVNSQCAVTRCTVRDRRGQRLGIALVNAVTKDPVGLGLRQIRSETKAFR